MTDQHTLKIEDAAKVLDMSTKTVRTKIKEAGLPFTRPGRAYLFSREEILAWKRNQRSPAKTPRPHESKPDDVDAALGIDD